MSKKLTELSDTVATARTTRRSFIGTSGMTVAGAAAFAFGKANMAEAAPVQEPDSWDMEADVVVIGFGGAGTCAAIEAAEAGAQVVAFEKASNAGGNTAHSGGVIYLGGGTPLQKQHGFDDTPDNMYTYLEAAMGQTADKERLRYYADHSVEHYEWLTGLGIEFGQKYWEGKVVQPPAQEGGLSYSGNEANWPYSEIAEPAPRGHMPAGAGAAVYAPLKARADELGIEVHYNTAGERLVVNEEGRVVGVRVRTGAVDPSATPAAGATPVPQEELYVKARQGVILTTGGFQFNREMLAVHAPWYLPAFPLGGPHQGDDGSGIKMAQAVGADVVNMGSASPWKFIYAPGEMCKAILVDGRGARIVNESAYGEDVGNAIIRRAGGVAWLVMTEAIAREVEAAGGPPPMATYTADTLEELAEQMGVDVAVFTNTVNFYNEQAAEGHDPLFHKKADYLMPLDQGPFLAIDFGINTGIPFITLGGLRANVNCEVLDSFDEVIPGLYAAGRTAPGISNEVYNSGTAVGDCTFWGRVAGRSAAAADPVAE